MSLRLGSEMRMDGARVPRESGRLLLTRRPQVLLMALGRVCRMTRFSCGTQWVGYSNSCSLEIYTTKRGLMQHTGSKQRRRATYKIFSCFSNHHTLPA